MKISSKDISFQKHQTGAVLVVGLLLLVVITILAVSGMNTATTELTMARNDQVYENAFQAAETGLEQALAQGPFNPAGTLTLPTYTAGNESVDARVDFEEETFVPPTRAFSLGSGVAAYHFNAVSQATSAALPGSASERDASAVHTQSFFVVGPTSPSAL